MKPGLMRSMRTTITGGRAMSKAMVILDNLSYVIRERFKILRQVRVHTAQGRLTMALLNLADRVPLVDVKFFVTAVMLQRETGGNLAEILDNLSYVIRERFQILR